MNIDDQEIEVWKDIEGFEGMYQISNKKRVKSLERYCRGKGKSYRPIPEKMLSVQKTKTGYEIVSLSDDSKRIVYSLNKLYKKAFTQ